MSPVPLICFIFFSCKQSVTVHNEIKSDTVAGRTWWNYKTVNDPSEENDSSSVLNYFRKVVQLRKENPALIYGKYTLLDKENPDVYAYSRELNGKKFLILLSFKRKPNYDAALI